MSTDQKASERIGELVQRVYDSLLQANTDLERIQDLTGLGLDRRQLLTPHSQATWKFVVPQEQKFRESWNNFISAMERVESNAGNSQQATVATVDPIPAPALPAIVTQTPEEVPVLRDKNQDLQEPTPPKPAPPAPTTLATVTVKEEEQVQNLPPAGSVDNPMEVDDSDDEIVGRASHASPKRRIDAPPPGGETSAKRLKPTNSRPPGSKDLNSLTAPQTQVVTTRAAEPPTKPSSSEGYVWKPHRDAKIEGYGENRKLLHGRLDLLGPPFDVDRSRITHGQLHITRMNIAHIYGGNSVSSFPAIRKEAQARHPYRNFLHGNFDHNPFLPPEPGWPGLFFRLDEKNDHRTPEGEPIVYRTFARHADKRCVYLGQYIFVKLEDISRQEWRELSDKTKSIWLRFFGRTLLANRVLARIALRVSLGEEPTEAQILAKIESMKPPGVRKALAAKLQLDIRKAFNRGEERIVVWGMKCTSYDYDFEVDLVAKWKTLDPPAPRPSSSRPKGNTAYWRKFLESITDDSEDEDEAPIPMSRDHLSRVAKRKNHDPYQVDDPVSAMDSGSGLTSDEDDEGLYHNAEEDLVG